MLTVVLMNGTKCKVIMCIIICHVSLCHPILEIPGQRKIQNRGMMITFKP